MFLIDSKTGFQHRDTTGVMTTIGFRHHQFSCRSLAAHRSHLLRIERRSETELTASR